MRRVAIDPDRPALDVIALAASLLKEDGVIAYPTETFYALGAQVGSETARRRIFEIKGRDAVKELPLIVSDRDQLRRLCVVSPRAEALGVEFWPGPLTLVLPAHGAGPHPPLSEGAPPPSRWAQGCPRAVWAQGCPLEGAVSWAVRVSSSRVARALAEAAGPITSTSANRSGEPPAATAEEVEAALGRELDLLLDAGRTPGGAPSTIVDLTDGPPRLVREGAIPFERIERALARLDSSSGTS